MRTKIVATIGPATASPDRIRSLADAGVDVFRINFAHGTHEAHAATIREVRAAAAELDKPIALLADLAGPKIRVGRLPEPVALTAESEIVFAPESEAEPGEIPTTYDALARDLAVGDRVLLDDGIMELRVLESKPPRVRCSVVRGGLLHANKGMNLPGVRVSAPALTAKDLTDLEFAVSMEVDYIGLSFVRQPEDVAELRGRLPDGILIVAKIEKDSAVANIEPILAEADAVMVARGDLGVELPFEQVPIAQKQIIQLANLFGRPVITATQMLESMIESPRPTRAEASDVANAVFDGTDAVMLSGETAIGRYPVLAVEAMFRIVRRIEAAEDGGRPRYDLPTKRRLRAGATPTEHAIAAATVEAVQLLGAPAIVTLTRTGFTTRLVSSYRPSVPIIAVSDQEFTYRQLALVWGAQSVWFRGEIAYEEMLEAAKRYILEREVARPGDRIVVTAGVPFHVRGTTNMLRVEEL